VDAGVSDQTAAGHRSAGARYCLGNPSFRGRFMLWPAAKSILHAYPAGLIRHPAYVMRTCRLAAREMYPHLLTPIGYQTLLFAACFHDVGKLEELAMHPVTGDVFYTDRGQRFGHILLGRDMLLDAARELNVPRELVERVDELTLGHQGKKEWDTLRKPWPLEAIILSAADYFDSQIGNMGMALRPTPKAWATTTSSCARSTGTCTWPTRPSAWSTTWSSIPIGRRRTEAPPENQRKRTPAEVGTPAGVFAFCGVPAGRRRTGRRPARVPGRLALRHVVREPAPQRVFRNDPGLDELLDVVGAAGLEARARQAQAAEGLPAHQRARNLAVD